MNKNYTKKYAKYKTKYLNFKNLKKLDELDEFNEANKFTISSTSFNDEEFMEKIYTRYGLNQVPNITWSKVPNDGTVELLLLCYDPDAKNVAHKVWIHWFVTNIDVKTETLINNHYTVQMNSFKNKNYDGPHPPNNTGIHHYHFKIFALKKVISFDENKQYEYDEIIDLINQVDHYETEIIGLYEC